MKINKTHELIVLFKHFEPSIFKLLILVIGHNEDDVWPGSWLCGSRVVRPEQGEQQGDEKCVWLFHRGLIRAELHWVKNGSVF